METPHNGMATVFRSAGYETEAQLVRAMLESNGLPAFITGVEGMPSWYRMPKREICVQVPEDRRDEAGRLISEARAAGPAAAEQAVGEYGL